MMRGKKKENSVAAIPMDTYRNAILDNARREQERIAATLARLGVRVDLAKLEDRDT